MKAPLQSPEMADFVANLERINALAEASPGYVWRLQDEAGDATAIRPFGDEVLVNMSVWRGVRSLSDYVYKSAHTEEMCIRDRSIPIDPPAQRVAYEPASQPQPYASMEWTEEQKARAIASSQNVFSDKNYTPKQPASTYTPPATLSLIHI